MEPSTALDLAMAIRKRYLAPGNSHVMELADAAAEIESFAARAVAAERERCMGALLLVRINLETGRFTMDDVIQCIRSGSQP